MSEFHEYIINGEATQKENADVWLKSNCLNDVDGHLLTNCN